MAWRGVHISKPASLKLSGKQLVVMQQDGDVLIPVEDIAWLVLDTPQITMTGSLLSALAGGGVATIVTDSRHHPSGTLLPFHQHYAQAHIAHMQTNISVPLKKRLWQALIVAKINNQAALLKSLGLPRADMLQAIALRVASGDPDNLEAQAARTYWAALFSGFVRKNSDDKRNALLNYGYAIVRAALARACTASGLLPAFGLHHASRSNAFNLVDDLIEPFRPYVDRMVYGRMENTEGESLTVEDRRYMAEILNKTAQIGGATTSILNATETIAASTVRAMEHNSASLLQTPG